MTVKKLFIILRNYTIKILYAKEINKRNMTFENSMDMGKEYQKKTRSVILRTLIMKNNIVIRVLFL